MRLFLTMVSIFLLSACLDSKSPASDPKKAEPDMRLVGLWKATDKDETIYYHVGRPQDPLGKNFLRVLQIPHKKTGLDNKIADWIVFNSLVGKATYLNMISMGEGEFNRVEKVGWAPPPEGKFQIVRYELEGATLKLFSLDHKALISAVTSGKIEGVKDSVGGATLTAATDKLAAFLNAEGDKLYPRSKPPLLLKKIDR